MVPIETHLKISEDYVHTSSEENTRLGIGITTTLSVFITLLSLQSEQIQMNLVKFKCV